MGKEGVELVAGCVGEVEERVVEFVEEERVDVMKGFEGGRKGG